MLVGSMELLKADDTKEHLTMFLTELQKAELLAPALIDPAPLEEEEGEQKILPGSKVQFPMLSASDGKRYFMGFTDEGEYRLWEEKNQPCPTFALKFDAKERRWSNEQCAGHHRQPLRSKSGAE